MLIGYKNEVSIVGKKKKKGFTSQCESRMFWMEIKLHIMLLLWTCGAFPLSNIVLCPKNFTSMITGWQIVISWEVDIKCCWGQSSIVNGALTSSVCPLTKPPPHPPQLPLPHASSLNNFSALSRWHLLAYFLSYPFISCHFFSEASQVAAAKRNGRWLE